MLRAGKCQQLCLFGFLLALGVSPAAGVLNWIFTPLAVALGLWLYFRSPLDYLSFTFWTWMLTPLLRRLADLHSGYHAVSLVMIAPVAVTGISVLSLIRFHKNGDRRIIVVFSLLIAVLLYGFFIGLPEAGLPAASFALANWLVPAIFGMHILMSPQSHDGKIGAIFSALVWGMLVIGVYGLLQYYTMPAWDAFWMISSDLKSIGYPFPQEVRVFGTLNSPAPYACMLVASLLVALASFNKIAAVAAVPGVLALLLSSVRSAWGGGILGAVALILFSKAQRKIQYFSIGGILFLLIIPVILNSSFGDSVISRTQSFSNLSEDTSFADRLALYKTFSGKALNMVVGVGLGNTGTVSTRIGSGSLFDAASSIDSGILESFYIFGVLCFIFFILLIVLVGYGFAGARKNEQSLTAWSIGLTTLAQLPLTNTLPGVSAMLIYPMLVLAFLGTDTIAQTADFKL